MAKNLTGAASIAYGSTLPSPSLTQDGTLFYKTDSIGQPQGLYVLSFKLDDAPTLGNQSNQAWYPAVASGINADTLDGLDSTAFQPIDSDLTVLAALAGTGLLVRTGPGGAATRTILVSGPGLSTANPDGVSGHPQIIMTESGLTLQNLGGVLTVPKGGTGQSTAPSAGSIVYGASASALGFSTVGTAGQVLTSGGAGAPTWVNQSALSTSTSWANITTLGVFASAVQTFAATPSATVITTARPSYHFDMGNNPGVATMAPTAFPPNSISGFSAYDSLDAGQFQTGLTVVASGGVYGLQIAAGWNFEEAAPSGLRFRVNDDTGTTSAWGAWRTIWDQGNWPASYTPSTFTFTGAIVATGDITAFSDARLKRDIQLITDPIDRVKRLNGVTFERIDTGKRGVGLIAQDVQAVFPEAVMTNDEGMLSVAYGNLVGLLVETVKAQQQQIDALLSRVDRHERVLHSMG
jgi:hypothetical protein